MAPRRIVALALVALALAGCTAGPSTTTTSSSGTTTSTRPASPTTSRGNGYPGGVTPQPHPTTPTPAQEPAVAGVAEAEKAYGPLVNDLTQVLTSDVVQYELKWKPLAVTAEKLQGRCVARVTRSGDGGTSSHPDNRDKLQAAVNPVLAKHGFEQAEIFVDGPFRYRELFANGPKREYAQVALSGASHVTVFVRIPDSAC